MILYFLLLVGFSFTTQVPRVPASFAKSSAACELVFDNPVRRVYPKYSIVTGERFIAHIDHRSCSLRSLQTHDSSSCADNTCTDQATSVAKIDDTTLYYCYSDNESPKPFTATLLPNNTYVYASGGLSDICLTDASKTSFTDLNLDDQLLYIASGSFDSGLKYYYISDERTGEAPSPGPRGGEVKEMTGIFVRGNYTYTVYLDKDFSKITRSCKNDQSNSKSNGRNEITSFTVANIQCLNTIDGIQLKLDRVLALEYNPELDKLFILSTKRPVTSSAVALCVVDVAAEIDNVFDTSPYYVIDEFGRTVKRKQGAIDCAPTRRAVVDAVCVNNVTTSRVASTLEYTDVFTFASYKTLEHYLFYFLSDDSVYVYEYFPDTDKTKNLVDVLLWEEASSISIHNDSLYLTLEESIVVTDPYWCSYYGKDPIGCLASMFPTCSYSKAQSRCLPTAECSSSDDCVQDLESGSFSDNFPEGYSYQVRGTECLNDKIYTDITVTIYPNTTVSTVQSYRDCNPEPVNPVTSNPVVHGSTLLSTREIGFVAGLVALGAISLFLSFVLFCKGKNRVGNICTSFQVDPPKIKYTADDKRAIVQPTTPTTPTSDHFNVSNGAHELVIRNVSANAEEA